VQNCQCAQTVIQGLQNETIVHCMLMFAVTFTDSGCQKIWAWATSGNILALPGGTEENHKHDRKSVYNVALMCICISTVALESNKCYII
jgi:hypothetical protein